MSSSLLLGSLVACAVLTVTASLNEAQFKQKLTSDVSVPFTASIKAYDSGVTHLSQLLESYQPEDDLPPEISPELTAAVNEFVAKIKLSSKNSHSLAEVTSKSVTDQTNLVTQTETKIQNNQKAITQNEQKLKGQQQQLNSAQASLNTANQNLKTHEDALRRAEKRYSDAKSKCLGRRRRKRGLFKKLKKIVKKTVRLPVKVVKETAKLPKKIVKETYRGLCRTLNVFTKNIDKAKRDVGNARGQVNSATAQVTQKRAELTATQKQLEALKKQRTELTNQKNTFQAQLVSLKASRDKIQAVDQKMKKTVTFIDDIKSRGSSAKFVVDLGYLLDPENLVQPLTEVGNVMKGALGGGGGVLVPKMTAAQIQAMTAKIAEIKLKLATPAFSTTTSSS